MPPRSAAKTVRRSVAISGVLVREASSMAPPELKSNFNRLVTVALQEYAARRKAESFAEAMRRMAADPAIIKESSSIQREFLPAESDGLNE